MKLSTLNTKTLKLIGTGLTVIGAIASLASGIVDPAVQEKTMKEEIAKQIKLQK
nr:MAG TPA: hypothetical protein [Caudoviricetes sp.]